MALPAGRYGVTKRQLNKVQNLPVDTIGMFHDLHDTLVDAEVVEGKNLINFPYSSPSGLYNGITVTINDDGTIKAIGTAQGRAVIYIANSLAMYDLQNGDYIVTAEGIPTNCGLIVDAYNNDTWSKQLAQVLASYPSVNITVDHDGYNHLNSYIYINDGATVDVTIKPMIRKASETDATYEAPYIPLKDVVPTKADNSVIAPVEDQATCQNPDGYVVGGHFIRNHKFCTAITGIANGATFTLNTNYVEGTIADNLIKQATFSGTTSNTGIIILSIPTGAHVLGVEITNVLTITYRRTSDPYLGIKCLNPSSMDILSETSVSGTYFYI